MSSLLPDSSASQASCAPTISAAPTPIGTCASTNTAKLADAHCPRKPAAVRNTPATTHSRLLTRSARIPVGS